MKKQTEVQDYQHYPVVVVEDSHALTTSLNVAEYFGKSHKNVIRDIENLSCPEAMSEEFWRLNFEPREYVDSRGKVQPLYRMTRSGFTLLVMGYTGPKALRYKIAYINQFDAMEAYIREPENRKYIGRLEQALDDQGMRNRLLARKANKISDEEKAEMVALRKQGLKINAIAEKMCRSYSAVEEHLIAARKAGRFETSPGEGWLLPEVR